MSQGAEFRSNIAGRFVDKKMEHIKDGADIKVAGLAVCPSGWKLGHKYLTWLSLVVICLQGGR